MKPPAKVKLPQAEVQDEEPEEEQRAGGEEVGGRVRRWGEGGGDGCGRDCFTLGMIGQLPDS